MATKRMDGDERYNTILAAGAKLAGKYGAVNVTRNMVAKEAKISAPLVSYYMGSSADAQKLYAKQAKKLGIAQPDKAKIEEIGRKMRAHGPRKSKVVRKRSIKEVSAIKRKTKMRNGAPENTVRTTSPAQAVATLAEPVTPVNVPPVAPAKKPAAKKTAARAPLAPPAAPAGGDA